MSLVPLKSRAPLDSDLPAVEAPPDDGKLYPHPRHPHVVFMRWKDKTKYFSEYVGGCSHCAFLADGATTEQECRASYCSGGVWIPKAVLVAKRLTK